MEAMVEMAQIMAVFRTMVVPVVPQDVVLVVKVAVTLGPIVVAVMRFLDNQVLVAAVAAVLEDQTTVIPLDVPMMVQVAALEEIEKWMAVMVPMVLMGGQVYLVLQGLVVDMLVVSSCLVVKLVLVLLVPTVLAAAAVAAVVPKVASPVTMVLVRLAVAAVVLAAVVVAELVALVAVVLLVFTYL